MPAFSLGKRTAVFFIKDPYRLLGFSWERDGYSTVASISFFQFNLGIEHVWGRSWGKKRSGDWSVLGNLRHGAINFKR